MAYYLGLDIGGTNLKAGLIDDDGRILKQNRTPARVASRTAEMVLDAAAELLDELIAAAPGDVVSLGVGSPGVIAERSRIVRAYNLPFENLDVAAALRERTGLFVAVGNDANVAALAESRYGAGRGKKSVVLVTLGTGVGGGVVIGDRVYDGFNGSGCEIGHLVLVYGGEPCTCGRRGCIEAYASATALIRQAKAAGEKYPDSALGRALRSGVRISGRTAFQLAGQGDEAAVAVVRQYIDYVGAACANYLNAYMPEILLIGGGLSHEGLAFIDAVAAVALGEAFLFPEVGCPEIRAAMLGNDAGIVGAAAFGRDALADA